MRRKLTEKQIKSIPKMLEKKYIHEIASDFEVCRQTVTYWIGKLRESGVEILENKFRSSKRGPKPLL